MLPLTFISGIFQYIRDGSFLAHLAGLFPVRPLVLVNIRAFGIHDDGRTAIHLAVVEEVQPARSRRLWTQKGLLALLWTFRRVGDLLFMTITPDSIWGQHSILWTEGVF